MQDQRSCNQFYVLDTVFHHILQLERSTLSTTSITTKYSLGIKNSMVGFESKFEEIVLFAFYCRYTQRRQTVYTSQHASTKDCSWDYMWYPVHAEKI